MLIEINNLTAVPIDKQFLRQVAGKALKTGGFRRTAGLSIALIGERQIRDLNNKYRRVNRATDVLAFGQNQKKITKGRKFRFVEPPDNILRLGEVVICPAEAKKNAKIIGHSFEKELAALLIHGILHLAGYGDESDAKKLKMIKKQEEILKNLKIQNI